MTARIVIRATASVSALFLFVLCCATPLFAQSATGALQGTVVDQQGAVLPGVTVTATNAGTGVARMMTTDASGAFRAELLPVGQYTVAAELSGFAPASQAVAVTVGGTLTMKLEMRLATVSE